MQSITNPAVIMQSITNPAVIKQFVTVTDQDGGSARDSNALWITMG